MHLLYGPASQQDLNPRIHDHRSRVVYSTTVLQPLHQTRIVSSSTFIELAIGIHLYIWWAFWPCRDKTYWEQHFGKNRIVRWAVKHYPACSAALDKPTLQRNWSTQYVWWKLIWAYLIVAVIEVLWLAVMTERIWFHFLQPTNFFPVDPAILKFVRCLGT